MRTKFFKGDQLREMEIKEQTELSNPYQRIQCRLFSSELWAVFFVVCQCLPFASLRVVDGLLPEC